MGSEPTRPRRRRRRARRRGRRRRRRRRGRARRRRHRHASSAPTATRSAATARRPPAPTGSTTPTSTRTASPTAAPRPPTTRSSSTAARPRRATSRSATGRRCSSPTPIDVTVVGIATFGDDDSFGPSTYTAFTDDAARELLAPRPDAISEILVVAEDGVSQESLRDEIAAAAAGAHRGAHARRARSPSRRTRSSRTSSACSR